MKIDYSKELNEAQLKAVLTLDGPVLVIAGAGSGKTRTIVYRLAYLVEQGIPPESILLLTFTRKAAGEMLKRAEALLGVELQGISGGTFHSFAYAMLRKFAKALDAPQGFSIIDTSDAKDILAQARASLHLDKDRGFPNKNTLYDLISRSRNKEMSLEDFLSNYAYHLIKFLPEIERIYSYYKKFKQEHYLLDYDDILFSFEGLLLQKEEIRHFLQQFFQYIMVDEYQDTNLVQGRLIKLLAGDRGNVMAVGDDAQSIYGFRGATVDNILNFPKLFPEAKIIKLEQNYRSTQNILELTNYILSQAKEKYPKKLFSAKKGKCKPEIIYTTSDLSQAQVVVKKIQELAESYPYSEIAVLFRAGYQSYALEMELTRVGIAFHKYGGQKFAEAAHIKDILAFLRLVANPCDVLAWTRALSNLKGVGPKTCQRLYLAFMEGNSELSKNICKGKEELAEVLDKLEQLRFRSLPPMQVLEEIMSIYGPIMEEKFVDDLPKRVAGVEQLLQIASTYDNLDIFLADLSLEPSFREEKERDRLVLSTIHSAKGLEWSAVLILDLVEERFPSRMAMQDPKEIEEERRLLYVGCTRAREYLALLVPATIYNRYQNSFEPVSPSPFIQEIDFKLVKRLKETYFGEIVALEEKLEKVEDKKKNNFTATGNYCEHKIFGRGKVIAHIPPNKYKVNFPKFGLKLVLGDYLTFK